MKYRKGGKALINNELLEILKADKRARERVSDASEINERMQKHLAEDAVRLEKKYSSDSERAIAESKEKHERTLRKIQELYAEKGDTASQTLKTLYDEKKNAWISEIVRAVTEA